jgi:polyhydroxybutyrate depolymerase
MSNGGMMSYTLACDTALFAAIGPVSGIQLDPCRSPHPTSVLAIHGTADPLIPYGGGPGRGFVHINGPSVPQVNAFWRNVDHCDAPADATSGSVTTSTAGCADNRSVVLVTIDGGGHHWPDFATEKLWQFFAAHPR